MENPGQKKKFTKVFKNGKKLYDLKLISKTLLSRINLLENTYKKTKSIKIKNNVKSKAEAINKIFIDAYKQKKTLLKSDDMNDLINNTQYSENIENMKKLYIESEENQIINYFDIDGEIREQELNKNLVKKHIEKMNDVYLKSKKINNDSAFKNLTKAGIINNKIQITLKENTNIEPNSNKMKSIILYDYYLDYNLKKANESLYSNGQISNAKIQFLFVNIRKNNAQFTILQVRYDLDGFISFRKDTDMATLFENVRIRKNRAEASDILVFVIGYRILYKGIVIDGDVTNSIKENTYKKLRAFNPSNDRNFHNLTIESTHNNKICIYETFLSVNDLHTLKYKKDKEFISKLELEEDEIKKSVYDGLLVDALILLNKKYNKTSLIYFYGDLDRKPLYIDNEGEIIEDYNIDVNDNTKVFLYDERKAHIAPSIYINIKNISNKDIKLSNKLKKADIIQYCLKPNILKDKEDVKTSKDIINNCLCFDFETFKDNNNVSIPYNICIYGYLKGDFIVKSFYGLNCVSLFFEFLKPYIIPLNYSRTRETKKVDYIRLYGYNNAKFDNLFIFKQFYELDKNTKYIFSGSSIKYIQHNNIEVYDINLTYSGSLRNNCKSLKMEEEKGIFPYNFVKDSNLFYIGSFPEIEFFNKEDFYIRDKDEKICDKTEETILNNYNKLKESYNNIFNCKEYTEKYCVLDCKLTFELVKEHLKNSIGEIKLNDKVIRYDVSEAKTGAGLSLKMFNQVFQKDELYGSPENILIKEKMAYYGGRTEVFKKSFLSNDDDDKLFYLDINSSYPYSMTKKMPYKYIRTSKMKEILNIDDIIDYNLYGISSYKYIGDDKDNIINNLLERNEKGLNISVLEYNNITYHWGCELREAIKNGFEIKIFEIDEYEGKEIFNDFSNYFYNKRLEIKKTQPAMALFYKLIMNSLYGKFGQRQFDTNELIETDSDIWDKITGNFDFIKDIVRIDNKLSMLSYESHGDDLKCVGNLTRLSSYISALSRCNLSEVMRDIGHKNIYYCDTDSIFTIKKPDSKYIDNSILGKWKEEEETGIKEAIFIAPKLYFYSTFDNQDVKKAKGVKAEKIEIDEYRELNEDKILNIKKSSLMFFRSLNGVIIKDQERTIKKVYNKRIWNDNNSSAFKNIEEFNLNQ